MPRPVFEMPDRYPFSCELAVRVTDINYGGHLGNDALLGLVHEARLRWLAQHGFSETDVGGVGLIMTDLCVRFRAEAFRGDRLRVDVAPVESGRGTFALAYRITRPRDGAAVAEVRTGMAFFDYRRRRPARMPPAFAETLPPKPGSAGGTT
jgi:acyl-CoA thioesterase FadM